MGDILLIFFFFPHAHGLGEGDLDIKKDKNLPYNRGGERERELITTLDKNGIFLHPLPRLFRAPPRGPFYHEKRLYEKILFSTYALAVPYLRPRSFCISSRTSPLWPF